MPPLTLYGLLDRLSPRSFKLKLFVIAFVGALVPVLAYAALGSVLEFDTRHLFFLLGGATIGTGTSLVGLHLALKPVEAATEAIRRYEAERTIVEVPIHYQDEAGQLLQAVHRLVTTTETVLQRQELAAVMDPLTAVANRRGFRAAVERIAAVEAETTQTCGLIVIDIDHFKAVNDRFGHVAGDVVLSEMGRLLAESVRGDDIVARFGGEEFVIFLPEATAANARRVGERIRNAVALHDFQGPSRLSVTISAGVAVGPRRAFDTDDLYERADRALYRAKHAGRNRVVCDPLFGEDGAHADGRTPIRHPADIATAALRPEPQARQSFTTEMSGASTAFMPTT